MDLKPDKCDMVADLTSADSLRLAFNQLHREHGDKIAAVIHLAAYFDFTGVKSVLYEEVNVEGTRRLLDALEPFDVERFIYSGTMLVHKPVSPGEYVTEGSPLAPGWAYPESKAETEAVIQQYGERIPYTLLHLAGLYDENTAVPTLSHQIARIYERAMESHLYSGNLDAGQAFIHLEDMLEVFKRCVDKRTEMPAACTLLAGESEVMSYRELQDALGYQLHGEKQWSTYTLPESIAKAGAWVQEKAEPVVPDALDHGEKPFIKPFMINLSSDHYALDLSRAKQLLDWEPRHFIGDELSSMVGNLKKDPAAWYEHNGIRPPDWMLDAAEKTDKPERLRRRHENWYREEHARNLWGHLFNIGLGFWLIMSVVRLDYQSTGMVYSDILAGCAIIVFAFLSLSWSLPAARWATAAVGIWVMSAPLLMWAPEPSAYLNGTLVGSLVVGFSVLLRPAPGVSPLAAMTGPTIPPGWHYSPSGWFQRLPIIVLAFIGFFISSYMAAYQLGHVDGLWEPFFAGAVPGDGKNGTEEITTSSVSEAWPVPDAGVGALVYLLEILVGVAGSARRWRTMPWLTTLFGILIVPLGAVSITFIIIQPILLNTWCTLCLIAATAMLLQIPLSVDELVATGQFLWRRKSQGHSLLRVFIFGDTDEGHVQKNAGDSFQMVSLRAATREVLSGNVRWSWGLGTCIVAGGLLMLSRILFGVEGPLADAHHLIGALLITLSVTALAEVARPVRLVNIFLGLGLLICTFILEAGLLATVASLVLAVVIIVCSIPRGPVKGSYGNWNRIIV